MKSKKMFLSVIALFAMMALPVKALPDGLETVLEVKSKKTLPYPRATRLTQASAKENMGSNETPCGQDDFNAPSNRGEWGTLWK